VIQRIFLSSVQSELAEERRAIRDFIHGDALLRRFFSVFLFEELPATDRRADQLYLHEVDRCDLFVSLLGAEYGTQDAAGVSPTEREFDRASERRKTRFVFIKETKEKERHPKIQALIRRIEHQLVRRKFQGKAELIGGLYAALVQYLEETQRIRSGPFDAAPCQRATLDDLDTDRMQRFIRRARGSRGFPLVENAAGRELLTRLNLLDEDRPTQAAVLLFARQPQRFLLSSEVKCAHFHGTQVAKPIPSYQVYKGTVFDLIDQAVDFVLSKIDLAVGSRAEGTAAPVAYEIPQEVVREAIVNAVAHRDYTSAGSVQVMLFEDRLEVWNPGSLPASLTLDLLRTAHGSVPGNPLLAESLYLTRYIERMGTGTRDMIDRCREAGLPEPDFELGDGFVVRLGRPAAAIRELPGKPLGGTKSALSRHQVMILRKCQQEQPLTVLLLAAGRSDRTKFRNQVLRPLLEEGLVELTIPDKPTSSRQKYRLTALGRSTLARIDEEGRS